MKEFLKTAFIVFTFVCIATILALMASILATQQKAKERRPSSSRLHATYQTNTANEYRVSTSVSAQPQRPTGLTKDVSRAENIETEEKFEYQTIRTGQSLWGIVKDHQKKHPWYTRALFLADNPEIANRTPYTKLDPCDSTKVLYTTVPIYPGDTCRLRLDEGGPMSPPNG